MPVKKFIAERQRFFEVLQQVDFLRVIPSQANYFLCEVTSRFSSTKLVFFYCWSIISC